MKTLLLVCLVSFTGGVGSQAFAQGTGYWHTSGNEILDSNNQAVRIAGINWYGFETSDEVAHGLYAQDYESILNTIKSNGYNTIRMPFSNQMVESPIVPSNINYSNGMNAALAGLNSLQILDQIVTYAGQIGLRIILDNHRSEAGDGPEANGLWYTSAYPETSWISDWEMLASRYYGNTTVIGFDLRNEPHNATSGGSCWGCGTMSNDWRLAAERGGNAVQGVNPNLLLFVEGTDCYNGSCDWWGGNLAGAQQYPVAFNVGNRLVYSAHDYGPNLYGQNWFNGSTTDQSLISIWTQFWAYLSLNNTAPVWVGEFGTTNNSSDIENSAAGSQGQWFQDLVGFFQSNPELSWTYWALNGEDSYALLDSNYDPTPVSALKQQLLATIQFPLSNGGGGSKPSAPRKLRASAVSSSTIQLSWTASTTTGVTYNVFRSTIAAFTPSTVNQIASGVTTTSYTNSGLAASTTYYYRVNAQNANGSSTATNQASAKTLSGGGGGLSCVVTYANVNQWNTGFTGSIEIANTGTSAITGWTLTWSFAAGQQVTQAWNANYSQSGATVTLTNESYNATIPAGGNVSGIGFNANWSGTNPNPTAFQVNGTNCQ